MEMSVKSTVKLAVNTFSQTLLSLSKNYESKKCSNRRDEGHDQHCKPRSYKSI
jgi:hypothetical protein